MCFRPPSAGKKEIKCPKCGAVNLPTAKKCVKCGAEESEFAQPAAPPAGSHPHCRRRLRQPMPKGPSRPPSGPPEEPDDET